MTKKQPSKPELTGQLTALPQGEVDKCRKLFKNAILAICGNDQTRARLKAVGAEAARLANRARPWSGAYLYVLLHPENYPAYKLNQKLLRAVLQMAGQTAKLETTRVEVFARNVRPGAVVLARSRRCARRRCGIHFVPVQPNQKFCSKECAEKRRP